jgi:hypothetical protein
METVKQKALEIVSKLPDDMSMEEIMQELYKEFKEKKTDEK